MNAWWTSHLPKALRGRLEGREELQKVLGNTGWLFVEKGLRIGIGFFVNIWITRYLGPERFGTLTYASALVMLFSFLVMLGLDGVAVRNLVLEPERRDEILGTAFLLKLTGSAVALIAAVGSALLLQGSASTVVLLVAVISLGTLFQGFTAIDFWFQSRVESRYSSWGRSAAFLLGSAVKIVLILMDAPLTAFAWAAAADIVLAAVGLVVVYESRVGRLRSWQPTAAMAARLLRDSWPLIFSDVLVLTLMRVDKIMIGEMAGHAELGVYGAAAMVCDTLYLIPMVVCSSLFPGIVAARETDAELFRDRVQRLYNLMAFLGYAVAVPATLLAGRVIPLLFGPGYAGAAPILVVLSWAGLFVNLMIARSYYLTAMNWTRLHLVTDFIGCILCVTLYALLIPRFGGLGAATASVAGYWFMTHLLCFAFAPLAPTGIMITRALVRPRIWQ